ncbi:MAG: DUF1684 domain-containing protein [Haloarculaceae archaeon]
MGTTGDDWIERIERAREEKREFFRSHPHSPLPPSQRDDAFPGLEYYPVDPAYRFVLALHEHADKEQVTVSTTADGEQTYRRWGEFRFDLAGESLTLQVYRPEGEADRFWVPFRDETNGETTYPGGRYLDLEPDDHRIDDGRWVLDFNAAYNPTCAYNAGFECPLVPTDNWLSVPVPAGEKDFPGDPHD